MKTPAVPPDIRPIRDGMEPSRFVELLGRMGESVVTQAYLPWDKLRYKTPPGDMTVEEWWLVTKLARMSIERSVDPLLDKAGQPFHYSLPDEVLQLVDQVARGASGQIAISGQVTDSATRNRYVISSLIEEAITSSQLEGASTTRRVAKDMIRTGREPRTKSERMIFNNYVAMRRIVELRDEKLTPELVCEIHRMVTDGTLHDPESAGQLQSDDSKRVAVWGDGNQLLHQPPPVAELGQRLDRLCAFANGESGPAYIPPILRSVALHFMMGYDHYFEDGNGRTARAIFYWSMLREGYWLTEFLTISKILKAAPSKYARAFLLTEDDGGDLTYFFLHQLRVVVRAIDELHVYLGRKAEELNSIQQRIRAIPGAYNYRQLALLEHAARNAGSAYTAQSHGSSHNVTDQSARNDLVDLEHRGLLKRTKIGRRHAWIPVEDLVGLLAAEN